MRIVLLGAPGAGKGTQARFIVEKYNILQISTGNMLRDAITSSSQLGEQVKITMDAGQLVTDALVISLVKERISQGENRNGFLLDGFPRTLSQANAMKEAGISIDYVLEFSISDELVIDRIMGRRIHAVTGDIYHIKFNPPPKTGNKDNVIDKELIIRQDDQEETVHKRLAEYHKMTVPLISYYAKEAQVGNIKYAKIDGTKPIFEVHADLEKILG